MYDLVMFFRPVYDDYFVSDWNTGKIWDKELTLEEAKRISNRKGENEKWHLPEDSTP
jgi:hypothetical protein